ncbi:tRNA(His) guanylyltransferase Thg1 family protein [Polyangium sp. y55x31]|uniref:tRNA(His) guanylyltransferase Thg1 family protein n=1 Tax=Polyangium sp. y55x31 TaxID=3042688 RepID=UPI0024824BC2|nr:tRNA(His) guanylyltransferase Thg1 family protein [Polyangium sp. y55x31]MDI1482717.1 tRNA(His) guanylyltransferase Thg1 family protein [Polyangium sp. y55x31]
MKFDDLEAKMRIFETAHDHHVLPGIYMVARLDGRGFTKLVRERKPFEAPFDVRVRDMMVETTKHLMDCGFPVVYGYTQSDEISLLFRRDTDVFGRKLRKYESILAGEASAKFARLLDDHAAFDARISQLPTEKDVVDYFRWRHEDAHRNALGGHCYWLLRSQGLSDRAATRRLEGQSVAERNELLFQNGIQFNELPAWQKRGVGLHYRDVEHVGRDGRDGSAVVTTRRRLHVEFELPLGMAYTAFVQQRIEEATPAKTPRGDEERLEP